MATAPDRLTLETIVDMAVEVAESDGLSAVTMRGIATRLGVSSMAAYHYVTTKEDLLTLVADRYFAEIEYPTADGLPWRERVAESFRAVHRVFARHPLLAEIVAAQAVDGIAAHRGAEAVLGALRDAGLSEGDAAAAFDTLRSFAIGAGRRHYLDARFEPGLQLILDGVAVQIERSAE